MSIHLTSSDIATCSDVMIDRYDEKVIMHDMQYIIVLETYII